MAESRTLSTEHQRPGDAKKPTDTLDRNQTPAVDDPEGRGVRAHVDKDGAVHGSGRGAGGGNSGEDYDGDSAGGGGALPG